MKTKNEYKSGDRVKITVVGAFIDQTGVLVERIQGKMWHLIIDEMPLKFRENEFQSIPLD